jgi:hypothetical protein
MKVKVGIYFIGTQDAMNKCSNKLYTIRIISSLSEVEHLNVWVKAKAYLQHNDVYHLGQIKIMLKFISWKKVFNMTQQKLRHAWIQQADFKHRVEIAIRASGESSREKR